MKKRPKIEQFCEAFPGRISLSDIDGVVEVNGRFLILEWKDDPKPLPTGQRIMFGWWARLPDRMFTIICVAGSAETMHVTHAMHYLNQNSAWHPRDFHWVWAFMHRWATWAASRPRLMEVA